MQPNKAQRDYASDCFASTRPCWKRFGASTVELGRISSLSIAKPFVNAQADMQQAGERQAKFQGLQQGVVVQATGIGLKAGWCSEGRRQPSKMNHKK